MISTLLDPSDLINASWMNEFTLTSIQIYKDRSNIDIESNANREADAAIDKLKGKLHTHFLFFLHETVGIGETAKRWWSEVDKQLGRYEQIEEEGISETASRIISSRAISHSR